MAGLCLVGVCACLLSDLHRTLALCHRRFQHLFHMFQPWLRAIHRVNAGSRDVQWLQETGPWLEAIR